VACSYCPPTSAEVSRCPPRLLLSWLLTLSMISSLSVLGSWWREVATKRAAGVRAPVPGWAAAAGRGECAARVAVGRGTHSAGWRTGSAGVEPGSRVRGQMAARVAQHGGRAARVAVSSLGLRARLSVWRRGRSCGLRIVAACTPIRFGFPLCRPPASLAMSPQAGKAGQLCPGKARQGSRRVRVSGQS
jgi:hypothetical protein